MEYGNLAYDEEYYVPGKQNKPQKRHTPLRRNKQSRIKYIRYIAAIVIMSLAAGFMVSSFVAVNETRAEISALEKQLAEAEAVTSQKAFDLDHKIDLATVEEEATSRLGMKRPEKYQTVYVNVSREDVTEKTVGEVENAENALGDWLKGVIGNIVEFFSIK